MMRRDRGPIARRTFFLVAPLLLPACFTGCTPKAQQTVVEAGLSAIAQAATQYVDFAASVARSAFAAYGF